MINVKRAMCGIGLGVACPFVVEVLFNYGVSLSPIYYTMIFLVGLVLGVFLGRLISWAWLVGSIAGAVIGFYLALLWMAYSASELNYEAGLIQMFAIAVIGLIVGGYGFDRLFKSRHRG